MFGAKIDPSRSDIGHKSSLQVNSSKVNIAQAF